MLTEIFKIMIRIDSKKIFTTSYTADLDTSTEEILNGKLHFLCSVYTFYSR